jgi:hypothetical protein
MSDFKWNIPSGAQEQKHQNMIPLRKRWTNKKENLKLYKLDGIVCF